MGQNDSATSAPRRITLQDVADRAGVCRMTVYNALTGQLKESWPKTRESAERIRRIASEMGYRPNALARATRTGRCGNIVLLSSGNHGWHSTPLVRAMCLAAEKRDYRLMIAEMDDHHFEQEDLIPAVLRGWTADAILVNYISHRPARVRELVESSTLPALWLNVKEAQNSVYFADYEAAVTATHKLLELGHENIAYFASGSRVERPHYSVADRRQGVLDALSARGLPLTDCPIVQTKDFDQRERSADVFVRIRELLARIRPTAAVCYGVSHAYQVAFAAATMGWKIPDDLSIVTFTDSIPDELGFPIAWMHQPTHVFCADAIDMAIGKIENPTKPLPSRCTEFTFFGGRSLSAPRRN